MENRVTGANAPMSLGELRQAICATTFGNPLFTPEEQLAYNHLAHESEDAEHLAHFLRATRRKDADRSFLARNEAARSVPTPAVCLSAAAQDAEVTALMRCAALSGNQQWAVARHSGNPTYAPSTRLRALGDDYRLLLDNLGGYEQRHRGYAALYDN
jgi:hypothetical protein